TVLIEWFARTQADGTRNTALNPICGLVFVDIYTSHQLWWHVLEAQATTGVGGKGVATIKLASSLGHTTNYRTRTFHADMVGIVSSGKALDRDPWNTLHCFQHAAVRQGADVIGGDCIHKRV